MLKKSGLTLNLKLEVEGFLIAHKVYRKVYSLTKYQVQENSKRSQ